MKLAIMQPYFFPYIGYFQLMVAADLFVVYDNIKYTKKGWINRNRMLVNGKAVTFSLPLEKGSDFLNVCERELMTNFNSNKLLNQFNGAYRRAPYFSQTFSLIEQIVRYEDRNLFNFLWHSLVKICEHLEITTEIRTSSSIPIDHNLKSQNKVLALCESVSASTYVNAIGGIELYSDEVFQKKSIDLKFIQSYPFEYTQFENKFVPGLSIIDVMMFNSVDEIKAYILTNTGLI